MIKSHASGYKAITAENRVLLPELQMREGERRREGEPPHTLGKPIFPPGNPHGATPIFQPRCPDFESEVIQR